MGLALLDSPRSEFENPVEHEFEVRDFVRQALSGPFASYQGAERRRDRRYPYPYPIFLTPLEANGETIGGESMVVVGKHLSERGLDFYCHQPLPHRRVIASLEVGPEAWIGLLLDLTWCRFTRFGWYENGGRFLRVAAKQPNVTRKTA